ncbi:hypothetical protein SAMD00023353_0303610 [Rosellinia necatrix]|uniref:Uncharacterized protein n=1 Tax=Rosellinia necatrix TaxID=77044 RepID=A0A1W2TDY6_ROSNE|nr:hypothetical protein SAMD00023353_0303610 [Rosellinia necatrix]
MGSARPHNEAASMDVTGINTQLLTQTLVESFNALADEVQNLSDRQTILEHKLRYAHEQFQYLADKYAAAAPEVSDTLVNLQVPSELHNSSLANTNFVPLPNRKTSDSKHQIAVIIREGRRVASSLTDFSKSSQTSRSRDSLNPTTMTSMSTILEQDFTVEGKRKGSLDCPFSQLSEQEPQNAGNRSHQDAATKHDDPICAAMFDEMGSQAAAAKCPIRYLDQHSSAEIADYVEKHKHELPRSHEVCVRRYQRSEEHIRKLDAKYGNLASMVEGLGKIHQPMLPEQDTRPQSDVERVSDDRVQDWAHTVSATVADDPDQTARDSGEEDEERQSHFDRPLKEVRVGESPSRPWGISVPVFSDGQSSQGIPRHRPDSPPPAPVHMPSPVPSAGMSSQKPGKCPFDHSKLTPIMNDATPHKHEDKSSIQLPDAQPFNQPFTPARQTLPTQTAVSSLPQPAFFNTTELPRSKPGGPSPQMVFTGPVFIGYPIEQAIQFMQHFQPPQQ